jgi:6-phosphogluconate dehydrogenase (decarboxylating)
MQIGLVGLGRMSANMSRRWLRDRHAMVGYARHAETPAIDVGAPAPILTTALYQRFMSRGEADFADRVLSAMRFGFGGHEEQKG